jgi:hypothetical protein
VDNGADTGVDNGADTGVDNGADTGVDNGADTGVDNGGVDSGGVDSEEEMIRLLLFIKYELGYVTLSESELTFDEWLYLAKHASNTQESEDAVQSMISFKERERRQRHERRAQNGVNHTKTSFTQTYVNYAVLGAVSCGLYILERMRHS